MKLLITFRSILMIILYIPVLMFFSILSITLNLILNNRPLEDVIAIWWGRVSCWMFGVKVRAIGIENVPRGGCIYLFNHTSWFDIFAMQAVLKGFRFGAKIELFSIPVFGMAMRRLGALQIAREKRDEVFKVYLAAQHRIEKGEKFALSPEGTRQHEEKLGAFKSGPFVFAINARAPLVPVVIHGAAAVMPKDSWIPNSDRWFRTITVTVLPEVSTLEYDLKARPALQEKVRNLMLPYFTSVHS
ncbi:MAG: 1-acyl-sn-glycerol-3-phosphate acyltransferase [Bdellovibrionaceae bacterium]|nr:1-acyl-sn-glycerol-3-phosphate acyltransferase [Pseudobdellovibrionaceae bacterium]